MKKYLIIFAIALILMACGYSTPIINAKEVPFVVYKILPYSDNFVKYVSLD